MSGTVRRACEIPLRTRVCSTGRARGPWQRNHYGHIACEAISQYVASHREGVPHHFPSTHRVIPSIVREGRGLPIIGHGHRAQLGSGLHRAQPCGAMYSHEYTLGSIKVSASQSDRVRGGQDMQLSSVRWVS